MKACDNRSVGVLLWSRERLLLIRRAQYPFGWAPPAGHQDGDNPRRTAIREVREEVGLVISGLRICDQGKFLNTCRRGGLFHYWHIYETGKISGEIQLNPTEALDFQWADSSDLQTLADRTNEKNLGRINPKTWKQNPGLETVWCDWLKLLEIIQ